MTIDFNKYLNKEPITVDEPTLEPTIPTVRDIPLDDIRASMEAYEDEIMGAIRNPPSDFDSEGHLTTSAAIDKLRESPFAFLTGVAGAGKSYTLNELNSIYPGYNQLAATTGIAGVNLNTTTINSILGFYDLYSLEQAYMEGKLTRKLNKVADEFRALTIDEVSMLSGEKLDIIVVALKEMNKVRAGMGKEGLKLWLTGDPLQLPPVLKKEAHESRWFFESEAWKEFEPNTIKLTKVWRQSNPQFLEALNAIRIGNGKLGAEILKSAGVKFASEIDTRFPGTTIVAKNEKVDAINSLAIMELRRKSGLPVKFTSRRWKQGSKKVSEWDNIPETLDLAIGAYVMILSNNRDQGFVNGDCGELVSEVEVEGVRGAIVRLARNSREVVVLPTVRDQFSFEEPYGITGEVQKYSSEGKSVYLEDFYNVSAPIKQKSRWLTGQIEYTPLRAGYSTTVHRSQGLTLDTIQCDIRDGFFSASAMVYVALSRARTLEGLRIVGSPELLATRVKTDMKVKRFL